MKMVKKEQLLLQTVLVTVYRVMLNTLKIGTITLNNVEAAVVEGGYPTEVLIRDVGIKSIGHEA